MVSLLLTLSFFVVAVTSLHTLPVNASHPDSGSDILVAYVTEPVIAPGQTIDVVVGLIDTGGNFIVDHAISVEHVESSNSSQITSSSELQTISLTIPGSTSIGIQELSVQSGNLSSTIDFWTSNSNSDYCSKFGNCHQESTSSKSGFINLRFEE